MPRIEQKARDFLFAASVEYNTVVKQKDQKSVREFYNYLSEMWDKQGASQEECSNSDDASQPWWESSSYFDCPW